MGPFHCREALEGVGEKCPLMHGAVLGRYQHQEEHREAASLVECILVQTPAVDFAFLVGGPHLIWWRGLRMGGELLAHLNFFGAAVLGD